MRTKTIPLALKLSVMISLLVIAGIVIVGVVMLNKQSTLQKQQVNDLGLAMAQQLAISITEPLFTDDQLSLQLLVNNFVELPRIQAAAVFSRQGEVLTHEGQTSVEMLSQALRTPKPQSTTLKDGRLVVTSPITFQDVIGGHVFIIVNTESLFAPYAGILKLALFVSLFVAASGLIAAYFISRHVSLPIKRLLEASIRLGEGSLDTRLTDRRNDEIGLLIDAFNAMGDGLYRKNQVEVLLSRFLAKDVADEVLSSLDTVRVGGERVEATVLFVDIAGFTGMSEALSPEQVAELLNEYFSYFTICSSMYFGTIDKFIGDCAMVVFGAPKKNEQHPFNAVACAVLMQKLNRTINAKRRQQNLPEVQLRIGINTGQMLAGVLGTNKRMEYTVVGDSVNLASRLCHEAEPGEIIISDHVYQSSDTALHIDVQTAHAIRVRGKSHLVNTYLVNGVTSEYQLTMDNFVEDVLNSRSVI